MPWASTSDSGDPAAPVGAPATSRVVEVAPERLEQWVSGFIERHGGEEGAPLPQRLAGADGATACFDYFPYDPIGLILVRRGGYAVGRVRDGKLVLHKVGTRYVQSRTAAGGWSQQRFARRRGNQADELVAAVADHAARILIDLVAPEETGELPVGATPRPGPGLVLGGDRQLVASVLADRRLVSLKELPARTLYNLPDPNRAVLEAAIKRARAVRITLAEPGEPPTPD